MYCPIHLTEQFIVEYRRKWGIFVSLLFLSIYFIFLGIYFYLVLFQDVHIHLNHTLLATLISGSFICSLFWLTQHESLQVNILFVNDGVTGMGYRLGWTEAASCILVPRLGDSCTKIHLHPTHSPCSPSTKPTTLVLEGHDEIKIQHFKLSSNLSPGTKLHSSLLAL